MTHKFRNCSCIIPKLEGKDEVEVGDSFDFEFFLRNYDEPVDITGATLVLTIVDDTYEPSITITKGIGTGLTIINPVNGHGTGLLDPADTSVLGPHGGPLFYELVLTDVTGEVTTVIQGRILLVE